VARYSGVAATPLALKPSNRPTGFYAGKAPYPCRGSHGPRRFLTAQTHGVAPSQKEGAPKRPLLPYLLTGLTQAAFASTCWSFATAGVSVSSHTGSLPPITLRTSPSVSIACKVELACVGAVDAATVCRTR
jgi:hypothetical protein